MVRPALPFRLLLGKVMDQWLFGTLSEGLPSGFLRSD